MLKRQRALTVFAPVACDPEISLDDLEDELRAIGERIRNHPEDLQALEVLHFLSVAVVRDRYARAEGEQADQSADNTPEGDDAQNAGSGAIVALEVTYDGRTKRAFLRKLTRSHNGLLAEIFARCEGAQDAFSDSGKAARWLAKYSYPSNMFYRGNPGRTVQQIKEEEALRTNIAQRMQRLYPCARSREDLWERLKASLTVDEKKLLDKTPWRPFFVLITSSDFWKRLSMALSLIMMAAFWVIGLVSAYNHVVLMRLPTVQQEPSFWPDLWGLLSLDPIEPLFSAAESIVLALVMPLVLAGIAFYVWRKEIPKSTVRKWRSSILWAGARKSAMLFLTLIAAVGFMMFVYWIIANMPWTVIFQRVLYVTTLQISVVSLLAGWLLLQYLSKRWVWLAWMSSFTIFGAVLTAVGGLLMFDLDSGISEFVLTVLMMIVPLLGIWLALGNSLPAGILLVAIYSFISACVAAVGVVITWVIGNPEMIPAGSTLALVIAAVIIMVLIYCYAQTDTAHAWNVFALVTFLSILLIVAMLTRSWGDSVVTYFSNYSLTHYLSYWFVFVAVLAGVIAIEFAKNFHKLRQQESRDDIEYPQLSMAELDQKRKRDSHQMQCHLVAVFDAKSDTVRVRNLRLVFIALKLAHLLYFNKGWLGSIPTIHSARWVALPDENRYIFFTNYDFSFAGYLGLFSDQEGTTAVFGNARGFPRPYMLMWDGARSEQLFKDYARSRQIETLIWYSAYPETTVLDIERGTRLRAALRRSVDSGNRGIVAAIWRLIKPLPLDDASISEILRSELKA